MAKGYWRDPARNWTESQERFLAAWWGLRPDAWVARTLGRTVNACKIRATRKLHQARSDNLLNARDVGRLFGVDPTTVTRQWHRRGWLVGQRSPVGCGAGNRMWTFSTTALVGFVHRHSWRYDPARMQAGHWLTDLAREVWDRDPWLTLPEVACLLHYDPPIVARWLRRLAFPHQHAPHLGTQAGPWQGRIVVRRSDVPRLRALIEETTRANRSVAAKRRVLRDAQRAPRHDLPNGRRVRVRQERRETGGWR